MFVPLLTISIAARSGHLALSGSFEWIGSTPALVTFALATVLEVAAYYLPWVDNLLDLVAGPAAVIAGVMVSASVIVGIDPYLKWTLSVIAGGGLAGAIQALSMGARQASTVTTAGLGNSIISSVEWSSSLFLSVLSLIAPLLVLIAVASFLIFAVARRRGHRAAT